MQGKVEIVCHGGLNFVLFVSTTRLGTKQQTYAKNISCSSPLTRGIRGSGMNELMLHGRFFLNIPVLRSFTWEF